MSYLISYDLNWPGQWYSKLYEEIKKLGPCLHPLDSVWIVAHPGPATFIRDLLRKYLDENDKLIVLKCSGEAAWVGFNQKESGWLKQNL